MAEFVEHELEQLLPVFEQLKLTQLMSADELSDFISQCRAFEYKCAKRTKRAKDFMVYAHYIADQIDAIGKRRRQLKFMHRYDQIERPLKHKCAFLHRIGSQRCKKLVYFREEIAFLRRANMFKQCSQAYTRLLNIHGNLASNHDEAARFEFFDNSHSTDSARNILQIALRKFPTEPRLWLTYFEIELRYVELILKRREFLLHNNWSRMNKKRRQKTDGTADNEEEESSPLDDVDDDDVLGLKLARIVYELAMKSVVDPAEKTKLLRVFLRVARECGDFADSLAHALKEHLQALGEHMDDDEEQQNENDVQQQQQSLIPDEQLFAVDTEGDPQQLDDATMGSDDDRRCCAGEDDDGTDNDICLVPSLSLKEDQNGEKADNKNKQETQRYTKTKKKSSVLDGFDPNDPELKLLLSKATLTEDYDRRPLAEVLHVSARQQKKLRLAQRASTAGPSWHQMPATELTDERRHDLEVLQMRDALDPAQHYRKPDREVLPKYFQVGQIVESKADFYSGRVPKRQRKRTMVEELMMDTELLARNKRRFTAIVRRREAITRGAFQRHGPMSKWSKRNNGKHGRRK